MGLKDYRLLLITVFAALSLAVLSACSSVSGTSANPGATANNAGGNSGGTSGDTSGGPPPPPPPGPPPGSFQSVQHIVFMAQENEGFDHYFGQINNYRASLGLSTDVNGTPANPQPNIAFTGQKSDGTYYCDIHGQPIPPFHMRTTCIPNLSPSWNESHVSYNRQNPTSTTFVGDGFAWTAGNYASTADDGGNEACGYRAMGYYTQDELPYYYFMATQYSMPDNWFAPAPTRTQPNRLYLYAATSHGHVYEPTATDGGQLGVPTIFDRLQAAGVSWKIYYTDCIDGTDTQTPGVTCASHGGPDQYFSNFSSSNNATMWAHLRPMSEYFSDLQNNTLPAVALIESGYEEGLDEHPKNDIEDGTKYVKSILDALQASQAWASSIFILTYDEGGNFYDSAPPLTVPSPDGIKPQDYLPGDWCSTTPDLPACDFTRTGFRLPVLVISPFSTLHGVSHVGYDNTAILKLIESRWNLAPLTQRDASMPDPSTDTSLFDWSAPNLKIPSNIPSSKPTAGTCNWSLIP
jgi:phospholipase C